MVLLVLFEHASGYSIFRCEEVEDIGALLPEVQEAVLDFARFGSMLTLDAFGPFKSGINALENINCISEGLVHDDLKVFLMNNVPMKKKKSKFVLGVADSKLGAAIQETLDIPCTSGGTVAEMLRGIRLYFHKLVSGLTAPAAAQAQLGLGHSYSRAKVKFNVHRSDNMIIQTISLLDQMDKDINTFSMRIREWYSYHFPELVKIVPDNYMYTKVVKFIGSRKDLTEDKLDALEELVMDSMKAEAIYEAAKMSMGMDISPIDLINIKMFATRVIALVEYRKKLSGYLSTKMGNVAPNLTTLIGEQVGARLISHAGSLTNLAKYPASTVQILGAEKALFRALKTKGNTPKYGLIFHSTFIGRAGAKNKGRISRFLANKCSLASRIDCFSDTPTTAFGDSLKEQVEERLNFFETGAVPRKNIDVMKEAVLQAAAAETTAMVEEGKTPKKKKKKKQQQQQVEEDEMDASESGTAEADTKKKKKRKRPIEDDDEMDTSAMGTSEVDTTMDESAMDISLSSKPKKKKKKKQMVVEEDEEADTAAAAVEEAPSTPVAKEKKKKKKQKEMASPSVELEGDTTVGEESLDVSMSKLKKKKKKRKSMPED